MGNQAKPRALIFVILDASTDTLQLNGHQKAVLVSLASHLNPKRNGTEVWPSLARLVALTGFGESTVRRALQKLHAGGLIKIRSDTGKSNTYTVNAEVIQQLTDPCHTGRGQTADPCQADTPTPVTLTGDPCQADTLTTKEQPIVNTVPSPIGCSGVSDIKDGDHQRKLAVHGLVQSVAEKFTAVQQEQPTEEKTQRKRA